MSGDAIHRGSCLCRNVRYSVNGDMDDVVACHCSQCRRTSGHHVAATRVARAELTIDPTDTLARYESSPGIFRSFCSRCGGNLFWEREAGATISITAGTLDAPTGLKLAAHIYVSDKGDYYEIADGMAQHHAGD